MNDLQLELTRLIGKKEDWNGCATYKKASLSDFHRWIDSQKWVHYWSQNRKTITIDSGIEEKDTVYIPYDSSKDLLPAYEGAPCQSEETLKQIVELIKSNQ